MDTPLKPEIFVENLGPEVKSFIYQTILEFEPFTTPETVVSVIAKNPLELLNFTAQEEDDNTTILHSEHGELPSKTRLKKMYRIAISLTEEGQTIQAEGLNENIYESITEAKNKLLKTLNEIQNDVISNQDRNAQIRHAMAAGGEVH
jgi:ribosome-associated translation inhibitor RaiA